ncbi:MAG: PEGA domain-containing protein [Deltaproteobacteria bacterium]|nr:PEGA domain-containing protein [Deltaproteobacteria bacterium]
MRIATPMGYSSRPPRKVWPVVLVLGLVLGLGGGIFAVAYFGGGDDDHPRQAATTVEGPGDAGGAKEKPPADGSSRGSAKPADGSGREPRSGSAGSAGTGSASNGSGSAGSGSASTGSGSAVVAVEEKEEEKVTLTIESTPAGATVKAPDGTTLGKTPAQFRWPVGDAKVAFELKLAGYKKKVTELVVKNNTTIGVELDPVPSLPPPYPGKGSGTKPPPGKGSGSSSGTGLMRPGD